MSPRGGKALTDNARSCVAAFADDKQSPIIYDVTFFGNISADLSSHHPITYDSLFVPSRAAGVTSFDVDRRVIDEVGFLGSLESRCC